MQFLSHGGYVVASLLALLAPSAGYAACSGAASPAALHEFESNPAAWLNANGGSPDIGALVESLAAAATDDKSKGFGAALSTLLGDASASQGTAIGAALASLVNSCTDPRDPADIGDKQYISANIIPNLLANANANTAYGQASGDQTAAIGGVALSGGTTGVGGQTGNGGFPNGASGGFTPNGPNGFATPPDGLGNFSASSTFTSSTTNVSP